MHLQPNAFFFRIGVRGRRFEARPSRVQRAARAVRVGARDGDDGYGGGAFFGVEGPFDAADWRGGDEVVSGFGLRGWLGDGMGYAGWGWEKIGVPCVPLSHSSSFGTPLLRGSGRHTSRV